MQENNCAQCPWRAKHDKKPKSLLGRLWRFHIRFCPGWRDYFQSLNTQEQEAVAEQYGLVVR